MEEQLKLLFANILTIDENLDINSLEMGDVPNWDSLGQLNLITGIEEEFGVFFSNEEILELNSYQKFLEVLLKKV